MIFEAWHAGTSRTLSDSQAWRPSSPQSQDASKSAYAADFKANKLDDSISSALQALASAIPEDEGLHLQQLLFMCNTVAKYLLFRYMNLPSEMLGAQALQGQSSTLHHQPDYGCCMGLWPALKLKGVQRMQQSCPGN